MDQVNNISDLRCPIGKFPFVQEDEYLVCTNCGAKFPIKEGIPFLIIDDAILPEEIKSVNELKCSVK